MDLLGLFLVVFAVGITPGPNNILLMRLAAQRGLLAAVPAIAGMLAGGSVLLLIVYAGIRSFRAFASIEPRWIALAGALYLLAQGIQLMRNSEVQGREDAGGGNGFWSLLVLQFVNPKAWTFMLTLVAASWGAHSANAGSGMARLLLAFVPVSALCAIAWAASGNLIGRFLQRPRHRARFDFGMGLLLAAYALYLPIQSGLIQ